MLASDGFLLAICPSSEHLALPPKLISGALVSSVGLILGGQLAVLQAPLLDLVCQLRPSSEPFANKNSEQNDPN